MSFILPYCKPRVNTATAKELNCPKNKDGAHCDHVKKGPIMMVLKDGHVLVECCLCERIAQKHRDHVPRD